MAVTYGVVLLHTIPTLMKTLRRFHFFRWSQREAIKSLLKKANVEIAGVHRMPV